MEFHSALAESGSLEEACDAIASELVRRLGPQPLDLMLVFASANYGDDLARLPVLLHERLAIGTLVGSTGEGLLHQTAMCSTRPAVTVVAGRVGPAEVACATLRDGDLPNADAPPSAWRALLPRTEGELRGMVVLGDPFHCDMRSLLTGLDFAAPNVPKVGGLASGSRHPDGNALFAGRHTVHSGAVLLSFAGAIDVAPVVSQGCRPIGRLGHITAADRNLLEAVDGRPVKTFIEEQLSTLPEEELTLADGHPLFLGVASDPFSAAEPEAGDFLVRNVLGIDDRGHLVVGEHLAVGRSIQLHVRDGHAGLLDLERRLVRGNAADADAALMFRCIGREGADHAEFARLAPDVPLAGCTCNGEIGPVGATTHLHGYTASCLLLRERSGA